VPEHGFGRGLRAAEISGDPFNNRPLVERLKWGPGADYNYQRIRRRLRSGEAGILESPQRVPGGTNAPFRAPSEGKYSCNLFSATS
jgi:hypothetical protein